MKTKIPFFLPYINRIETLSVKRFFYDGFFQNSFTENFEKNLALLFESRECLAVKSGTLAIHLALIALQIQPGDEVIISNVVCEGVLNAIEQIGAKPILIDIENETANIDSNLIEKAITKKTKCIIAVHYGGIPCEISKVISIAKTFKIPVIEDCAQALGARYKDTLCGQYGDIAIFSFYANKILTTGEGGIIMSNPKFIKKLKSFIFNKKELCYDFSKTSYQYQLKYNYLMDDLSSIIGIAQLSKLNKVLNLRKKLADKYNLHLENFSNFFIPCYPLHIEPSYYQYTIQLHKKTNIYNLINDFRKYNIPIYPDFFPNHKRIYYKSKYNLLEKNFPVSEELMHKRLCLPFYPKMSNKHLKCILKAFEKVF